MSIVITGGEAGGGFVRQYECLRVEGVFAAAQAHADGNWTRDGRTPPVILSVAKDLGGDGRTPPVILSVAKDLGGDGRRILRSFADAQDDGAATR